MLVRNLNSAVLRQAILHALVNHPNFLMRIHKSYQSFIEPISFMMEELDVDSSRGLLQTDGQVSRYATKGPVFLTVWSCIISLAVVSTTLCLLLSAYIISVKSESLRAEELSS
jgi:hypothetical protein